MPLKNTALIVFARMPVPGKAKTRLGATVGPAAAAEFYKLCAEQIFQCAHCCDSADAMVFCSDPTEVTDMQQWLQHNNTPMPVLPQQQTPDLGQRMLVALRSAATGAATSKAAAASTAAADQLHSSTSTSNINTSQQYKAALVVGTDIPDLTQHVINTAVTALETHDMVLGPAVDGGFYLMGFSTPALLKPEVEDGRVFESVQWSTDSVLQRTVAGAKKVGLHVAPTDTLPALQDIDTLQDLQMWFSTAHATALEQQASQQQGNMHNMLDAVPQAGGLAESVGKADSKQMSEVTKCDMAKNQAQQQHVSSVAAVAASDGGSCSGVQGHMQHRRHLLEHVRLLLCKHSNAQQT